MILVANFCKAGVSVPYSRHQDAEINEQKLYNSHVIALDNKKLQ